MVDIRWQLNSFGCCLRRYHTINSVVRLANQYLGIYGEDNKIPATFQIIHLIGWKPSDTTAKPLPRGSGQVSLKDYLEKESRREKDSAHVSWVYRLHCVCKGVQERANINLVAMHENPGLLTRGNIILCKERRGYLRQHIRIRRTLGCA